MRLSCSRPGGGGDSLALLLAVHAST
eukprot:COSAG04_NODE_16609_length_494_cov_0.551899_1_plen_25_part_10